MSSNKIYRVREGKGGVCVLQVLVDSPSLLGGQVDTTVRDIHWADVPYRSAPVLLFATGPERKMP